MKVNRLINCKILSSRMALFYFNSKNFPINNSTLDYNVKIPIINVNLKLSLLKHLLRKTLISAFANGKNIIFGAGD